MAELDRHSRLIAWLKIVLPLVALAILSTLFLVSRAIDPEEALPYAEVDVEDRLREPRMTGAAYSGITSDGAALTLTANEARPDAANPRSGTAIDLVGRLETPDGVRTDLTAGAATLDETARQILLSSGVTVTQSNGWKIASDEMVALMDNTDISSQVPVTASGPAGTLKANSMHLSAAGDGQQGYLVVFKGGVKLIYEPPR